MGQAIDILLHVGLPKTGTTSIQSALASRTELLARGGWWYGREGRDESVHHLGLINTFGFSPAGGKVSEDIPELTERIRHEVDQHAPVIISHESLCRFPYVSDEQLRAFLSLFDGYAVRVVIYLRRQDYWLESLYSQLVKRGRELRDIDEVAATFGQPYDGIATSFKEVIDFFGQVSEDIVVRPFAPSTLKGGDAVSDFFDILGLESIEVDQPSDLNRTPAATTVRTVVRLLQDRQFQELSPDEVEAVTMLLDRHLSQRDRQLLSGLARRKLLESVHEETAEIANRYLHESEAMTLLPDIEALELDPEERPDFAEDPLILVGRGLAKLMIMRRGS